MQVVKSIHDCPLLSCTFEMVKMLLGVVFLALLMFSLGVCVFVPVVDYS